jgi:tetratricopeptide (TPR) repeat protein
LAGISRVALSISLLATIALGLPNARGAQANPVTASATATAPATAAAGAAAAAVATARIPKTVPKKAAPAFLKKSPGRPAEIEALLQTPAHRPSREAMQGFDGELTKWIEANPKDAFALYVRGLLRFEMKDAAGSTSDLDAALLLNPKLARAYEQRGCNYALSGKSKEALQDFDSAIANGDTSINAYINRGSLEFTCGQNDRAIADLTQALDLCRGHGKGRAAHVDVERQWMPLMLRSDAYMANKNYDAALADVDAFITARSGPEPIKAEMQRRRGVALYHLGRYNEAIVALNEALENPKLFPGEKGRTTFIRGACYFKLGDSERAEADRARARVLGFREVGAGAGAGSGERPVDKPFAGERAKLDEMLKPYIEQARKTLPEIKARYQKGLPEKETLSVTTRLFGKDGRMEQVFVTVKNWNDDKINGLLASKVALEDHREGEALSVAEADVLDWTIVRADGSEEGNLIGKYLDSVQKGAADKAAAPIAKTAEVETPKIEEPKAVTPAVEKPSP